MVEFLVREGLADRLLAVHVDDGSGRCAVCSAGAQAARDVWPCVLASYATRAAQVQRGRTGQP